MVSSGEIIWCSNIFVGSGRVKVKFTLFLNGIIFFNTHIDGLLHKYCMPTFCEIMHFFNYKVPLHFQTLTGDVPFCDINGGVESHRLLFNNSNLLKLFLIYTGNNYIFEKILLYVLFKATESCVHDMPYCKTRSNEKKEIIGKIILQESSRLHVTG